MQDKCSSQTEICSVWK